MPDDERLERYLAATPTDVETARRAVEHTRRLSVAERMEALRALLRDMDVLLAGRTPKRSPDDENFWRHWKDPSLGRPR